MSKEKEVFIEQEKKKAFNAFCQNELSDLDWGGLTHGEFEAYGSATRKEGGDLLEYRVPCFVRMEGGGESEKFIFLAGAYKLGDDIHMSRVIMEAEEEEEIEGSRHGVVVLGAIKNWGEVFDLLEASKEKKVIEGGLGGEKINDVVGKRKPKL